MKPLYATLTMLFLAVVTSPNLYADTADEQTVQFTVEKMTCVTCPISVRKAMERVDGVINVVVDLDSKTATVLYDGGKATPDAIGAASTNVGFPATQKGNSDR